MIKLFPNKTIELALKGEQSQAWNKLRNNTESGFF